MPVIAFKICRCTSKIIVMFQWFFLLILSVIWLIRHSSVYRLTGRIFYIPRLLYLSRRKLYRTLRWQRQSDEGGNFRWNFDKSSSCPSTVMIYPVHILSQWFLKAFLLINDTKCILTICTWNNHIYILFTSDMHK